MNKTSYIIQASAHKHDTSINSVNSKQQQPKHYTDSEKRPSEIHWGLWRHPQFTSSSQQYKMSPNYKQINTLSLSTGGTIFWH